MGKAMNPCDKVIPIGVFRRCVIFPYIPHG